MFSIKERLRVRELVPAVINFEGDDINEYDDMVSVPAILGSYTFSPKKLNLNLKE